MQRKKDCQQQPAVFFYWIYRSDIFSGIILLSGLWAFYSFIN